MLPRFRHWSHQALAHLSALLPTSCALCGEMGRETMCAGCHAQFFGRQQHRCAQCAIPLPDANAAVCGDCLSQPPAFDATITAADYGAPVDQLVLGLKFGSQLAHAPLFARMLRDAALQSPLESPQVMTAVPLGAQRLAERGFNQALEIAKPLARLLNIDLDYSLVTRVRDTRAQALLHTDERQRNVRRAFVVPAAAIERVRGRHVGVVDDVLTTGETLNELAATLKRFGAARVTNFVFARTLQK